ncbi:synaptotagmin-4-like [Tachypleus tridentatus]|uniref:synaptotagmin-4-like n=1 Tax=Tachypleus tridentatus TaxID=6853 RepID=UPI003FD2F3AF
MKIPSSGTTAHIKDEPETKVIHGVTTTTVVGICAGSVVLIFTLVALTYYCYRRRASREAHKLTAVFRRNLPEEPLVPRKPTAVRSPSSGPGGLKKSPSPTSQKSPSDDRLVVAGSSRLLSPGVLEDTTKCSIEHDKIKVKDKTPSPVEEKDVIEEKPIKLGDLQFQLRYQSDKHALLVTIVRCVDLPAKDPNIRSSDPYVKLQLLPDKQHKVKTRVLRKTLQPVYDEEFTFYGITPSQLQTTTLHFVVLSFDRYSRDDVIGEVVYPMAGIEIEDLEKQITVTQEISPRTLKIRSQGRGELLVSLCYQPAANRLTVVVLKARNLPKMDITGLCDPYVKIYLLYNNQRIAKKKTHVKKRTVQPVFNESFVFEVPYNEGLENISLEFLVLDWDRVTKNEVIGRLEIGSKAGAAAQQHWTEVSHSPRRQIAEWHKLWE